MILHKIFCNQFVYSYKISFGMQSQLVSQLSGDQVIMIQKSILLSLLFEMQYTTRAFSHIGYKILVGQKNVEEKDLIFNSLSSQTFGDSLNDLGHKEYENLQGKMLSLEISKFSLCSRSSRGLTIP